LRGFLFGPDLLLAPPLGTPSAYVRIVARRGRFKAKEHAMLVLSRKTQEKIHIGDNITVTIVRVKGQTVRVGIEAPEEVRVVRGELLAGLGTPRRQSARQIGESSGKVEAPVAQTSSAGHRGNIATAPHSNTALPHGDTAPLHFAIEAPLPLKGLSTQTAVVEAQEKSCVDGRRRIPGASLAPLMRRPQRLGPASVGSLTGRLR
jgi:carbon storage regulator CsrA